MASNSGSKVFRIWRGRSLQDIYIKGKKKKKKI